MNNRLYRHPTDQVIGGVAAGVAAWLNVDPTIVRVAWVLLTIVTSGIGVLVYIVMLVVVPLPPAGWTPSEARPFAGGPTPPGGTAGWGQAPGSGSSTGWGQAGAPGAPGTAAGGTAGGAWQPQPGQPWTPPGIDSNRAGIVAGVVLVVLGVWFLVTQYIDIDIEWQLLWPIGIMLGGIALIVAAARRGRPGG